MLALCAIAQRAGKKGRKKGDRREGEKLIIVER